MPVNSTESGKDDASLFPQRLFDLEKLADELADQRLQLAEQWETLLQTRAQWAKDQEEAVAELEAAALGLQDQEQALAEREQALEPAEMQLRKRREEIAYMQLQLDGLQGRFHQRAISWEAERERLLLDISTRETRAELRWQAVEVLLHKWNLRRKQEQVQVRRDLATAEQLRREFAGIRDQWLRRHANLEKKERQLAEKTLALEQYRLECIGHSPDSPAAEKRLELLRRQWAAISVSAEKALAKQRQLLQTEIARLDTRQQQAHLDMEELASQRRKLAEGQASWEKEQLLMKDHQEELYGETHRLDALGRIHEKQLEQLRDEIETMARNMLDEPESVMTPIIVQAA